MTVKTINKSDLTAFAQNLIKLQKVVGVRKKETKFEFANLVNAAELELDYDVTLSSPRAFFQPSCEKLFDFKVGSKIELKPSIDTEPFILFGVHTYDLKALNQMDKIWADKNPDEHYLARRRAATIIALEPTQVSEWSFWSSMDAVAVKNGFDLLFTDIGDKYVVEVGSDKGGALLLKFPAFVHDATEKDLEKRADVRKKLGDLCKKDRAVKASTKEIPELLKASYDHPVWEAQAKTCYSCGSCNMVCPTCYCFDVNDNIELDLETGSRSRKWDGCLLENFAFVGSGENFREHKKDRFRHRIMRKTVYVPEKIGELACVGCGRCSSTCLPNITDPVYIINTIKEGK